MARPETKARQLAASFGEFVPWDARHETKAQVVINATSIGMSPNADQVPLDLTKTQGCRAVVDVVVSPMESLLIRNAKTMNMVTVPGYRMCLHQAAEQFRLYTGMDAPLEVMEKSIIQLLQAS